MKERQRLLESIASTIGDYRNGEIPTPTDAHVNRWVNQFETNVQLSLLRELDHVLKETYFAHEWVVEFLAKQVRNERLAGADPCAFWKNANFLRIQQNGHSQEHMLKLFGASLRSECKVRIRDCGSEGGPYLYVDDVLFSGGRVGNDLSAWLANDAPPRATVNILLIATHTLGEWQVGQRLKKEAKDNSKEIQFHFWRARALENRKAYRNSSEVLWPAVLPDDATLQAYLAEQDRFPFQPRQAGGKLEYEIFTSEEGRQLLEREFLLAGMRIRSLCRNPSRAMRPLGFSAFGVGFGSTIVTFRNCPNNCPLALWWGDPDAGPSSPLGGWYPLLPRKTYGEDPELHGFTS